MRTGTEILNELNSLSPLLASIPRTNVYAVPEGYFEGLAEQLTVLAQGQDANQLPVSAIPYLVPEGYFEGLAGQILNKVKALEPEAEESLPDFGRLETPYQIQSSYFDTLADEILNRVKLAETEDPLPFFGRLSTPLEAPPQDYFNRLGADIMGRINGEQEDSATETARLSPLLAGISRQMPYPLPAGYFDTLTSTAAQKAMGQTAKVVELGSRRLSWMRFAAAAALVGLVALSAILFFRGGRKPLEQQDLPGLANNNINQPPQPDTATVELNKQPPVVAEKEKASLAEVSDTDVFDMLQDYSADDKYLEAASNDLASLTSKDLPDLLKNISDEEIIKYLDENPESTSDLNN